MFLILRTDSMYAPYGSTMGYNLVKYCVKLLKIKKGFLKLIINVLKFKKWVFSTFFELLSQLPVSCSVK